MEGGKQRGKGEEDRGGKRGHSVKEKYMREKRGGNRENRFFKNVCQDINVRHKPNSYFTDI